MATSGVLKAAGVTETKRSGGHSNEFLSHLPNEIKQYLVNTLAPFTEILLVKP